MLNIYSAPKPKRKVVITGLGAISCIGKDLEEITSSLKDGKCGIQLLKERKDIGFRSGLSGIIENFSPQFPLDRRYRKTLPDFGIWAWEAISQALDHAEIPRKELAGNERCAFIFGNDSSVVTGVEQCDTLKSADNTREIGSGHIFRLLTSTVSLNLATKLQIRGSSWTVSGACASGAMSIGQAAQLISSGEQDMAICGGAQEISWQSMCSFDAIGAFSTRENAPHESSRPFDTNRDGLIPSGGAAALFLESEESAISRGANILAEITGFGTTSDGDHLSVPTGRGLERAMALAIEDACIHPSQIDLLMAHATSTPLGDEKEAEAICRLFDIQNHGKGPAIVATKALTGHEFWMAGASQVVYALLMSLNNFISGHPNFHKGSEWSSLLNISKHTKQATTDTILCNAAGFGGVNASLLICPKK